MKTKPVNKREGKLTMAFRSSSLLSTDYVQQIPHVCTELELMAQLSQKVLQSHADKKSDSWKHMPRESMHEHFLHLRLEIDEAEQAFDDWSAGPQSGIVHDVNLMKLACELGDINNLAMMIADTTGALKVAGPAASTQPVPCKLEERVPEELEKAIHGLIATVKRHGYEADIPTLHLLEIVRKANGQL